MKAYRAIRSHCEVFIPLEKRPKAYKVKAKTESGRLLAVLGSKTCLAYIPAKNVVTKTLFIKLYKFKNPLTLEKVSKSIEIRLLNDVVVTKDSTGEKVSLDLLEIDDIGLLKLTIPEVPRLSKLPKLLVPRPSKLLELLVSKLLELLAPRPSKPLEPIATGFFKLSEELIKPVDSSNLDEMQLDLVTSLYYRIKVKIFKKKLDKNNSILNIYKQALKSPNVKKWIVVTFNEFKQLINSKTFKFLFYEVFLKGRKLLTNRLVFKEKKDQYNVTIKFKARLMVKSFI